VSRASPARRLIAFLGPSLPAAEAQRVAPCTVLPPARQGDLWRALALRPTAIALIDGTFESVPSVWHHEILDALDAGVAVFGGASMGALRAAELARHGMVGVGRIYGWYRDGVVDGDDEVALLHAGPEHGHRPLTTPLVDVRRAAELLAEGGHVTLREARALVEAAARIFYQRRTWASVQAAAAPRLRPAAAAALAALIREAPPDPKGEDARATLAAADAFAASGVAAPPARPRRPSSHVRRRKLAEGLSVAGGAAVPSGQILVALQRRSDAAALADQGRRRLVLAGLARSLGLQATDPDRAQAADAFFAAAGVPERRRAAFLAQSGLDAADASRLFDDLALERALLDAAERAVPDGPNAAEGLAAGARLAGAWAAEAQRLAAPRRRKARRRSRARRRWETP
jgi:hypothetical protein